jgi:glutamate synthase (NADPH/NADH) large chain
MKKSGDSEHKQTNLAWDWKLTHQPKVWSEEHDACAIVAAIRKTGAPTHGNLKRAMEALSKMGHRSGVVNGEGDGCGVLTDIPRRLWADALEEEGKPAWLAEDRRFFVGHLMVPNERLDQFDRVQNQVLDLARKHGARILLSREGLTRPTALGRMARSQAPLFLQVAGLMEGCPLQSIERCLFDLSLSVERETGIHVASLSSYSVVYKVRGTIETLYQYYPELRSPEFTTAITLGHARYSTNTTTAFERVQPFTLLGHNGEINTIARLREQAEMLDVQLVPGGSDSQDVDRTLSTLLHHYGFSLIEAMELLFPPILSEVEKFPPEVLRTYLRYRQSFGPFAQGPAAIIARYEDQCEFSVDALGLRPLWFGETEKDIFFSSEKGVYHLDSLCRNPKPLSPGEKLLVRLCRNSGVDILDYSALQMEMQSLAEKRFGNRLGLRERRRQPAFVSEDSTKDELKELLLRPQGDQSSTQILESERRLAALGWGREDREWVQELAESGSDPIGSMGYDGPLAALSSERHNIPDYFKEAVAVVTNPSIDREREKEHFSTQSLVGPRPSLVPSFEPQLEPFTCAMPILCGASYRDDLLPGNLLRLLAMESESALLGDLIDSFPQNTVVNLCTCSQPGEQMQQAVQRLADEACRAVRMGAQVLILDDRQAFDSDRTWVDPHLSLAVIERALRNTFDDGEDQQDWSGSVFRRPTQLAAPRSSIRRKVGLVLVSGAIRNLHDLIMALGLGADAVVPYLLLEVAVNDVQRQMPVEQRLERLKNTLQALNAGLEKVISTMGIHELRGYGRLFASIGLSSSLAVAMGTVNYLGSQQCGLTWEKLDADAAARASVFRGETRPQLARENRFYPKVWKAAGQVSRGEGDPQAFEAQAETLAREMPVTLRHVLGFRFPENDSGISPYEVDAGLTGHDLPFVIASMSFGSQGEMAFRAYAQAAYWLNIIALNGEGGEIEDMMGRYPHNRGLQIASGRFGVSAAMINSANLLEIKIGQGAKPGEGGHLPGRKVTRKIAETRHASPGVDLISPSNNHDIYSIEDLAQFIEELKTSNPKARVVVKVPVVPGIGIIAVGIAKAGADVINLTGYDGGTGAARKHSLKFVGLPADIGVAQAHRELVAAGLRDQVEIWCDGGMRTAADSVKMICLGANRIGFGSMAMLAVGCTVCRACQKGTCHVGITTQIGSVEQAEKLGLRRFVPCEYEAAVTGLMSLFGALGIGVKTITARLGFRRTQELVGRSDLLEQTAHLDNLDLGELLLPAKQYVEEQAQKRKVLVLTGLENSNAGTLRRPRNHLTTVISNLVMETVLQGEEIISFEDDKVTPVDRALGTHLTGALTRLQNHWLWPPGHGGVGGSQETWRTPLGSNGNGNGNGNGKHLHDATLRFFASSVPGNGLGAYNANPVNILVEGGAQDGVAKGIHGGRVIVLKGYNHDGELIDGSVGKSLAYGATGGLVIIQGDADSRACIRLSGADVIIGGEIRQSIDDSRGYIGVHANVKGFLCEYMTDGRVLVLGDPGPWMCAGMTGGVLYFRLQPEWNFDWAAIQRRVARGAVVNLRTVEDSDEDNLNFLIGEYSSELARNHQKEEARRVSGYLESWKDEFVKIEAVGRQLDQSVASE